MSERFVLKNESSELPVFRSRARELLQRYGWNEQQTGEWVLILDEALTNVIRHAYAGAKGEIIVEVSDQSDHTAFVIEDRGKGYDPTKTPAPKLPKETPGGLGVHLIKSLTDRFEYEPLPGGGNRIRLIRNKINNRGCAEGAEQK